MNNDDEVWGAEKPGNTGNTVPSSFDEARVIEGDVNQNDVQQDASQSIAKPKKKKPNIVLLGVAGLLGVAALFGIAAVVGEKLGLFESAQKKTNDLVVIEESNPAKASVSPFEDKSQPAAAQTSAVVGAQAQDTPASAPVSAPANALTNATTGAPVPATPAPASSAPIAEPKQVAPVQETKAEPKEAEPEQAKAALPPKRKLVRTSRNVSHKESHKNQKSKQHASKRDMKNKTATDVVVPAPSAVASKEEVFLLPRGLRVTSVYPSSGNDALAWVQDAHGRTSIVRAGDSLSDGIQIIKIVPERNEVHTSSGVIGSAAK